MPQERKPEAELKRLTSKSATGAQDIVRADATGDELLVYGTEGGIRIDVRYHSETLWMTQRQMSDLFGVGIPAINKHLSNIYDEGELTPEATISKMEIVAADGKKRATNAYNLDAIISVGYRVSSKQATQFRIWATERLKEIILKGWSVDVKRMKEPESRDHFQELKETIRDIRASEANLYREVRSICALCSDYHIQTEKDKNRFFATVQNKLHYAVTSYTGAEIRLQRADASKPNMGLTTWSGDHPTQKDVLTAKNFLGEVEVRDLNRFTSMLLDYFEQETELRRLVIMEDAERKLDTFIQNNERPLLRNAGSVSKEAADEHAKAQYKIFNEKRRQLRHREAMETD